MSEQFTIDLFELSFLAEACSPPAPIARAMFWQDLTDKYWHQMSDSQREPFFNWLQKNLRYEESLKTEEDTQIFHARFDPENQYQIETEFQGKKEFHRAFLRDGKYWINRTTWIAEEYITSVEKLKVKIEY